MSADLLKAWTEAPESDRKAILGTLRGHVRQATERTAQYKKEHHDNLDPKILKAHDDRKETAELALQILGTE